MKPSKDAPVGQWATYLLDCGLSIFPLKIGRAPACRTTLPYQTRLATPEQLHHWFEVEKHPGIGIMGGAASGNLEIIDFDEAEIYHEFRELIDLPMCVVKSPGGYHVYYRCSNAVPSNMKVSAEDGSEVLSVRAKGLYVVAPGSRKQLYEKREGGATYDVVEGELHEIPDYRPDQRTSVRQALETFGRVEGTGGGPRATFNKDGKIPPGGRHDFIARAAWSMARRPRYTSAGDVNVIYAHLQELNKLCVDEHGKPAPRPAHELLDAAQSAVEKDNDLRAESANGEAGKGSQLVNAVYTPLNELAPEPEPEWFWEGAIARGWITLLIGQPKIGKTTLLTKLLGAMQQGEDFLGQPTQKCNLVITTEEHVTHWQRRVEQDGLDPNTRIQAVPFISKPRWKQWEHYVETIAEQASEIDLVILDPWINFTPAKENDADEVPKALMALRQLTELQMAVLVLHHAGREEDDRARGSSALDGFVDMMLSLTYANKREKNQDRKIIFRGRYPDSPGELKFSMNVFGDIIETSKRKSARLTREDVIRHLLSTVGSGDAMSIQEISAVGKIARPHVQSILKQMIEDKEIERIKVGTKFLYFNPLFDVMGC